jgi:hypothetical protein
VRQKKPVKPPKPMPPRREPKVVQPVVGPTAKICTAESPMPRQLPASEHGFDWVHPDAVENFKGTHFRMTTCPHCKREITERLL